jgi:hypothetical protein
MTSFRAHGSSVRRRLLRYASTLLLAVCVVCGAPSNGSESEGSEHRPEGATRLAVLPTIDLAMGEANLGDIDTTIEWRLAAMGFDLVPEGELNAFLSEHRIRYTGGLTLSVLTELRAEMGADAVFLGSVDLFEDEPPPRIALNSRVVSTLDGRIKWAGEIAIAGEDHPGLIGS